MANMRIGVFICACGPNISERVDIDTVATELSSMKSVVLSETFGMLCSPAGKDHLVKRITENRLDRLVIAACSPREHERTFAAVCTRAGINPFMMEMANIREQVAWVTPDRDSATRKAIRITAGAVERVRRHRPLEKVSIEADPGVLVVGAGLAGLTAAVIMADAGRSVTVLEREKTPGGDPPSKDDASLISTLVDRAVSHPGITLMANAVPGTTVGFLGRFTTLPEGEVEEGMELRAGAILLATGRVRGKNGCDDPAEGFRKLTEMLRVVIDDSGYPIPRHSTLHPVSTSMDGVFVCGRAAGALTKAEVVATAEAAAGVILSSLIPGRKMETEPKTSVISPTLCAGCRTCMEVCGFGAISYEPELMICVVNGILCKGCGNCAAACPSGAIRSEHFLPDQIRCQLSGLLS